MPSCDIVVTRYNEPWQQIDELLILFGSENSNVSFQAVVYNHGDKLDPQLPYKIFDVPNVGRESHTVHRYMIDHYSALPDIVAFVPGNWWTHRFPYLCYMISHLTHKTYTPNVYDYTWDDMKDFTIDEWKEKDDFVVCPDRPFGNWYTKHVGVPYKNAWNSFGMFSTTRERLLRYSIEQYETWCTELEDAGVNSEIGHYWERSWYSLFGDE